MNITTGHLHPWHPDSTDAEVDEWLQKIVDAQDEFVSFLNSEEFQGGRGANIEMALWVRARGFVIAVTGSGDEFATCEQIARRLNQRWRGKTNTPVSEAVVEIFSQYRKAHELCCALDVTFRSLDWTKRTMANVNDEDDPLFDDDEDAWLDVALSMAIERDRVVTATNEAELSAQLDRTPAL